MPPFFLGEAVVDGIVSGFGARAGRRSRRLRGWARLRGGTVAAARAIGGHAGIADANAARGGQFGQARLRLGDQRAGGFMLGGEANMDAVAILAHRNVNASQCIGGKLYARIAGIGIVAERFDAIDHVLQALILPQVEGRGVGFAGCRHACRPPQIDRRCRAEGD